MAKMTEMIIMKALTNIPITLDRSKPAERNVLPTELWSKLFSKPILSTRWLTAFPTTDPKMYPSAITIIAPNIAGIAVIMSPTMSFNTCTRSTIVHHFLVCCDISGIKYAIIFFDKKSKLTKKMPCS